MIANITYCTLFHLCILDLLSFKNCIRYSFNLSVLFRATNSPKTISVTLAAHYLSRRRLKRSHKTNGTKYPKGKWEQDVKVKRIIRHPYYDAFSNLGFRNDIAILLLEDKVEWNYGTRPVCLPTLPNKLNNSSGEDLKATLKSPRNENLTEDVKNPYHLDNDFLSGDSAIVAGWASVTGFFYYY